MKKIYFFTILCLSLFISCKNEEATIIEVENIGVEKNYSTIEKVFDILQVENLNFLNLKFDYDSENKQFVSQNSWGGVHLNTENIEFSSNKYVNFALFDFVLEDGKTELKGKTKFIFNEETNSQAGILLSFDDYFSGNWEKYLPLFVENDFKATWFCFGWPSRFKDFYFLAKESNQCVGYHSFSHNGILGKDSCSLEDLEYEAITPLNNFKEKNMLFTCFAFPNGLYKDFELPILKQHYSVLRFFGKESHFYTKEEILKQRAIYSKSIDFNKFADDEEFKSVIKNDFLIAKITDQIYPCTSHYILDEGEHLYSNGKIYDDYTISKEKLSFIFEMKNFFKLKDYTFDDFKVM